jgi:uncharacterized protein YbjT (DUF2867 family)
MILVTGATGNIGPGVVRSLLERGAPIRIAVHRTPLAVDGAPTVPLDFDRPETFAPALDGADTLFLLSAEVAHEAALIDAAGDAGIRRIVYISSFGANEDPFLVGRLHREMEERIAASGMAWTVLRPNYLMQNVLWLMADDIRREDAFYDSLGPRPVSMIDARDIGAAAARVLTEPGHEGRAYELSGLTAGPGASHARGSVASSGFPPARPVGLVLRFRRSLVGVDVRRIRRVDAKQR